MALAVAIGNRIDMDVRGFGNPPPPQCPDKVFVLQVCNSNSQRDDNFNVFLNGTLIGALDLNQDAQIGSVFIGSTDTNKTIVSPDFSCPLNNMVVYYFNPLISSVASLTFDGQL